MLLIVADCTPSTGKTVEDALMLVLMMNIMKFYFNYTANSISIHNDENSSLPGYWHERLGQYIVDLDPLHQGREARWIKAKLKRLGCTDPMQVALIVEKMLHGLRAKEHISLEFTPRGFASRRMRCRKIEDDRVLFNEDGSCRAIFTGQKMSNGGHHFIEVMLDGVMQYRTPEYIREAIKHKDAVMANFPSWWEKWHSEE